MNKNENIVNSKIIIATHFLAYSAAQALRDFLRTNKCNYLLYISHPLPLISTHLENRSFAQISKRRSIKYAYHTPLRFQNILLTTFFEFFLTLLWSFRTNTYYDLYIGINNLNAFSGLLLKKLGRVKKVVYYTIDYFPTRFENKFLNWLYHSIDKFCVRHADETWNASSVMVGAREKLNGMTGKEYKRQHTVPIGIWYDKTPRKTLSEIDRYKLVFTGHLLPHMGVDLAISALAKLREKFPKIKLEIIGSGPEGQKLKDLVKELRVENCVIFHGWISDRGRLEQILCRGAIGLAIFNTQILDDKVKNADPGKIKDYMACGLPVIATDAISTSRELEKAKCAIIIPYKKDAFINAITQFLENDKLFREYRENARRYIKKFDYKKIFFSNINRVLGK